MSKPAHMTASDLHQQERLALIAKGLKKRHAAEMRLKAYGIGAIVTAIGFLFVLMTSIISNGYSALQQTKLALNLDLPVEKLIDEDGLFSM